MANVFLSYDHEDVALARPIAAALEKAGHKVWYDRHIHGGAQYSRKIEQALDASDAVIVLWSPRSLESAWVRDEAAEGRDRGKLVPLSVEGVTAPMGFRQFQTIDLGSWRGRGKVPHLAELLEGVESQAGSDGDAPPLPITKPGTSQMLMPSWRLLAAAGALLLMVAAGFGVWKWIARNNLPVVEIASASGSPRSQAAASDLFVKLGALAQVGEGKWELVDAASAPRHPALIFRTADTGSAGAPQANLVLLDGKDDSLLWSREFTFPAGGEADLRQQMSLIAGRVLGCALESRDAGGLRRDLLKIFLTACANLAETSFDKPTKVAEQLRSVIDAKPGFVPAWGRLISADLDRISNARGDPQAQTIATRELQADMEKARKLDSTLPQLTIAEINLLPPRSFATSLDLLAKAIDQSPDSAALFAEQSGILQAVGRMNDGVVSAQRAAELDPLSPSANRQLILALAYSGQIDSARAELSRMERLWPGTGALRDAMWAFHLRYGDPAIARKYANFQDEGLDRLLNARADPTSANIEKVKAYIRPLERRPNAEILAAVIQALGEFNQIDDVFAWIARTPTDEVAQESYILFRPSLTGIRKDPRFVGVAKRIGLLDYWRSSGEWPDFCFDPTLPYDCKAEAAKYGA